MPYVDNAVAKRKKKKKKKSTLSDEILSTSEQSDLKFQMISLQPLTEHAGPVLVYADILDSERINLIFPFGLVGTR